MKIKKSVLIGCVVVLAVIGLFVFFTNFGQTLTGNAAATGTTASNPTSPTGTVRVIQATISHSEGYYFQGDAATDPTTITVNKGDTVKIITNDLNPSHNHGITIDAYGINQVTSADPTITFVADHTGTFPIYCEPCAQGPLGAHPWMVGTLIVQ